MESCSICLCVTSTSWTVSSKFIHVVAKCSFLLFQGQILFHCMYMPHFLYLFICEWTLELFHVLATVNAAMNIEGLISLEILISITSDKCPEMGLLDHMVVLTFSGISMLFCIAAVPFHIPTNKVQRFQFVHILTNTYCPLSFFWLLLLIAILIV